MKKIFSVVLFTATGEHGRQLMDVKKKMALVKKLYLIDESEYFTWQSMIRSLGKRVSHASDKLHGIYAYGCSTMHPELDSDLQPHRWPDVDE